MSNQDRSIHDDAITRRGFIFLATWSIGLALLLVCAARLAVVPVRSEAIATAGRNRARLDRLVADPGATSPKLELPQGVDPTLVTAGIYVDRIVDLSIKDASWTVDFYLWFRWTGEAVNPGNGFQVVDGQIELLGKFRTVELLNWN